MAPTQKQYENLIIMFYLNPLSAISFSSISRIKKFFGSDVSLQTVKRALSRLKTYTTTKPRRKQKLYNSFFVHRKRQVVQLDLASMPLSRANKGVNYLLIICDTASRFAWAFPLKKKSAVEVTAKFKSFLEAVDKKPERCHCDRGTEFTNKDFKALLRQHGIKQSHPRTSTHAPHAERLVQTIKGLIYKYLSSKKSNNYIDSLEDIITAYNNRVHSSIRMSPAEGEKDAVALTSALLSKYDREFMRTRKKKSDISIGDKVRILKDRVPFMKGYKGGYSDETFEVADCRNNLHIPLFTLKRLSGSKRGEEMFYSFYEDELQRVGSEFSLSDVPAYSILKERERGGKKEAFVNWLDFSSKYQTWIAKDLLDWTIAGEV